MHFHLITIHAMPSAQAVPLAAASIKAYLDARPDPGYACRVSLAEFFSGTAPEGIVDAVLAASPDVVGFPIYVWNREECTALIHLLRRHAPGLVICAGGPEVTADPAGVLHEAPCDFVVVGEGELTMAEVLDRLAAGDYCTGVAGVATRDGDGLMLARRPPIPDLGILPSPFLTGLLDTHIAGGVVWPLSRGCSFGCEFCFDGMGDRVVRRYPLERLEAELNYVVQRGVSQIFVLDSTFNQDVRRAKAILRLARKRAPTVHFHFEVRHELLDAEQASLFASLTCSLQIGLQSADPEVAGNVGRKFKREDFAAKVMLLNNAGATFGFDLIYGLPGDSLSRFREGLDFALSLYPNHLDIFPLSVLPGTKVAAKADVIGLRYLPKPPYTLLESPTFPAADMASAGRLASACDVFYSRGKAVAWFNAVLAALRMQPTAFLREFSSWLIEQEGEERQEAEFTDEAIWQMQRAFLTDLFSRRQKQRLLSLALDCVNYHYYYATCVMAVVPPLPPRHKLAVVDLLRSPLRLSSSAHLARFSHEIIDLLDWGEPDLPAMCGALPAVPCFAIIYPCRGEVRTESVDEAYYNLLEQLDGMTTAETAAKNCGLSPSDAREFLMFATAEGIALLPAVG